jgi:uncharacterized protein YoxC
VLTALNIALIAALVIAIVLIVVFSIRLKKAEKVKEEVEIRFVEMENQVNKLQLQTLEAKLKPAPV